MTLAKAVKLVKRSDAAMSYSSYGILYSLYLFYMVY